MDWSLVQNACGLVVELSLPVVGAALIGAVFVGVFQVATQISDESIGFAGKLAAVALSLYVTAAYLSSEIVAFTTSIWGEPRFF